MAERTHDLPLAWWANNLEELDAEIARLATLCDIRILEPGAIQRVLQKDASVCGSDNPIAFAKLRGLLTLHFAIREKSVGVFGQAETVAMEDYVIERLRKSFPNLVGPRPPV
jgi:hypothetical protein